MIDNKTIEFDPPPTSKVITVPMSNHGKGVNVVEDSIFVSSVKDLTTPLNIIKNNLLKARIFPDCVKDCICCTKQLNGCKGLKEGIQRMMDSHEILFEKTSLAKSLTNKYEDLSIITISNKPLRISSKGPIRISNEPIVTPLIITSPGPNPYSFNNAVPWSYSAEVFYHGIKQDAWIEEDKVDGIGNIIGSSKVTRTGRIFSPNISPLVVIKGSSASLLPSQVLIQGERKRLLSRS